MNDIPTSSTRYVAPLPDPRAEHTRRHRSRDSLTIASCAVLCGADACAGLVAFAGTNHAWLRTCLRWPGGILGHDPCGRGFAALDPEAFQARFRAWAPAVVPRTAAPVVPLDGQTRCGAQARGRGQAARHTVGAWASGRRPALGQVAVAEEAPALAAIPALLRVLALAGAPVTIDAAGCQTASATPIVARGGDAILALPKHHPTRHADGAATCTQERAAACAETPPGTWDDGKAVEQEHGRLDSRRHWVPRDPDLRASLKPAGAWANLHAIAPVERRRPVGDHPPTGERHHSLLRAPRCPGVRRGRPQPWGERKSGPSAPSTARLK